MTDETKQPGDDEKKSVERQAAEIAAEVAKRLARELEESGADCGKVEIHAVPLGGTSELGKALGSVLGGSEADHANLMLTLSTAVVMREALEMLERALHIWVSDPEEFAKRMQGAAELVDGARKKMGSENVPALIAVASITANFDEHVRDVIEAMEAKGESTDTAERSTTQALCFALVAAAKMDAEAGINHAREAKETEEAAGAFSLNGMLPKFNAETGKPSMRKEWVHVSPFDTDDSGNSDD